MLPKDRKAVLRKRIAKATAGGSSELVFPKLVEKAGGQPRIRDNPPTIFHAEASRAAGDMEMIRGSLAKYRETLAEDRRVLFDRYRLVEVAVKVVGIGSVGTLCMVALMMSIADHPLFLQIKQANASVLEAYAGKSVYAQHGERVVQGQRLMQPASDLFLGWVIGPAGRHVYIRQLRDVKLSPLVETYDAEMLSIYGKVCGWALARAHAKAGDPWTISGYLGKAAVRRGDGQIRARLCRPGRTGPRGVEGRGARRQRRGAAGALSAGGGPSAERMSKRLAPVPIVCLPLEQPSAGTVADGGDRRRYRTVEGNRKPGNPADHLAAALRGAISSTVPTRPLRTRSKSTKRFCLSA